MRKITANGIEHKHNGAELFALLAVRLDTQSILTANSAFADHFIGLDPILGLNCRKLCDS